MSWKEVTILVDRAKLGDRAAYGELVERFRGSVYAAALTRTRDPLEAEELTQDVFVHGMRKIAQLRDARCFAGWLRRIVARMAINRAARRGKVFGAETEVLEAVAGDNREPSEVVERDERAAELREGLSRLKPMDRQALEAFYLHGRSLKEIADDLSAPVGTVKRRLHVARQRLKETLGDDAVAGFKPPRAARREAELATAV